MQLINDATQICAFSDAKKAVSCKNCLAKAPYLIKERKTTKNKLNSKQPSLTQLFCQYKYWQLLGQNSTADLLDLLAENVQNKKINGFKKIST